MVIFKKYIYKKNGTFRNFLKSKFNPNIHQKRNNLHHLKKISRGSMSPNPPSKAHFPNLKKKFLRPPLPKPGYAPVGINHQNY